MIGMLKKSVKYLLAAAALLPLATVAHHGYPQYDLSDRVPLSGTILTYRLSNPHSHMTVRITNDQGEEEVWAVETTLTLRGMRDMGFSLDTLQPGDEVTFMVSPARNGDRTAVFQSVQLPDGRTLPASEEGD